MQIKEICGNLKRHKHNRNMNKDMDNYRTPKNDANLRRDKHNVSFQYLFSKVDVCA